MSTDEAIKFTAVIDLLILLVLAIDVYLSYQNYLNLTKK